MNMSKHSRLCKIQARRLGKTQANLIHTKALDLAAQEQRFKHYTTLHNLLKLLGPEGVPSELNITMAGGDPRDTPYKSVSSTVRSGWSEADPVSD